MILLMNVKPLKYLPRLPRMVSLFAAVGMLVFLTSLFGNGIAYNWILSISGIAGFIAWLYIVAQGRYVSDLPSKARLFPVWPIFAFGVCSFVIVGQGYSTWFADSPVAANIIACYIGVPVVIIYMLFVRVITKSKFIPLFEVDLDSGSEEILV
jgi:lysine-specific permease